MIARTVARLRQLFSLSSGERAGVRADRDQKVRLFCLLASAFCLLPSASHAATEIRAFVTITNIPAGLTSNLVINIGTATTRYWTNSAAAAPSTGIQTTNSTAASATNLLVHLVAYPLYSIGSSGPQLTVGYVSSNTSTLVFTAPLNTNLTVTFGGNWARVLYDTNTFADASPILSVTNTMSPRQRTNALNSLVNLLAATNTPASNSVPPGAHWLKHFSDNTSTQTSSNKTFTAPVLNGGRLVNATNITGTNTAFTNNVFYLVDARGVTVWSGYATAITNGAFWSNLFHASQISNAVAIGGVVHKLTNGYATNLTLGSPKSTNLINYGNAISSVGLGASAEQFGAGAVAGSDYNTAIGAGAGTTNLSATAIGRQTTASEWGTAVGSLANANTNSVAAGYGAAVGGYGNVGIGAGVDDNGYANVILIGYNVAGSADNQVIIGGSSQAVLIGGPLVAPVVTNATLRGTNVINARLDLTSRANTALANGYNSGVIFGTNTYIRFSGPTAAYTNAGFAAPGGPQFVHAQFDNPGLSFTILNESGLEVTAANRILTGTGSATPLNSTNNPVMATFLYDDTASRWRILSFR